MATTPQFAATPKVWTAATYLITSGGTTAYATATPTDVQLQGTGGVGYARSAGATAVGGATTPVGSVLLVTGGTNGSRVDEITFTSIVQSTANVGRIFIYDGARFFLYKEIAIPAVTPSVSIPTASVTTTFSNLILPSATYKIYVSVATVGNATTTDNGYAVMAFGGDF